MVRRLLPVIATAFALCGATSALAQDAAEQLKELREIITQQNHQIEELTEQIAKLNQKLSGPAPARAEAGIAPATQVPPVAKAVPAEAAPSRPSGPTHVVAKGETLTSIAKLYKVAVGELKTVNKIENDRTLQIGQTLIIPTPTPEPTPNP